MEPNRRPTRALNAVKVLRRTVSALRFVSAAVAHLSRWTEPFYDSMAWSFRRQPEG
jgi:hypothetical protein